MFNQNQHKIYLIRILKEIYDNRIIRSSLGFKGGTAAYLFYDLPRFSVDLDFDLLNEQKKEVVFAEIMKIVKQTGRLLEASEKRYTLFFLASYQKSERKIKIEISKRTPAARYEVRSYLGIPILVIKKEDAVSCKLAAFLTRKKFASRDLFDLWFFLKNNFSLNESVFKAQTGFSLKQGLKLAIKKTKSIAKNRLLQGMGELLDEKQKVWVRNNIQKDLAFYINLYL